MVGSLLIYAPYAQHLQTIGREHVKNAELENAMLHNAVRSLSLIIAQSHPLSSIATNIDTPRGKGELPIVEVLVLYQSDRA